MQKLEKELLCEYYDQLTKAEQKVLLGTARRGAERNMAARPKLRLIVSAVSIDSVAIEPSSLAG